MPLWIHEWIVAPTAFALALHHAGRALGRRRALVELLALASYGFALEWIAMTVFASHRYSDAWIVAPAGVPVAVALVWAAVISAAMALAVRAGARSGLHRAALAAALGIALDLLMEPVATRLGLWEWTPHGGWLAVPIGNFVGWAVIVGGYTLAAERWAGSGQLAVEIARRAGLATGAIAALVAVGAIWTRAGAESLFTGGRGWIAWALLVLAAPLLAGFPAAPSGRTLADRLAGTHGYGPLAVFAVVALAFAVDALVLGGRDLAIVAAASVLSLTAAMGRAASVKLSPAPARGDELLS